MALENKDSKEEVVQNIKDIGQSLIDNAEKIANNYKYPTSLTITCYPGARDDYPRIVVETEFVPEKLVERFI